MSSKNEDELSMLPEEIRFHILSLMPTKFAVQTSVLSKTWRCSWMFVTKLDFDDTLSKFVDRVMVSCKSSQIQLFRLRFSNTTCCEKADVSNWIDKAVNLHVRELDIQVNEFKVPLSLFTCKTLTKLRLHGSSIDDQSVWKFPNSVCLPCLKTLDIAVFSDPFVNMFNLIRGCPVLESLSLVVSRQEDYVFNISTLKQLKLTWLQCATVTINKVVLRVPNLEYLFVGGVLCSHFVMEDLSSLVEASTSLHSIPYDHLWVDFLKGVSGVKSLSIQNMNSIDSLFTSPMFPNMRNLEIKCCMHLGIISQFLDSSPQLQHICIEKEENCCCWVKPMLVPSSSIQTSLTSLKFSSCKGGNRGIKFLEYILRNAKVLKTVTIIWENLRVEEGRCLAAKVLNFPRASLHCEIHFHENWI
ncbi:hypothetical protein QVD17_33166 [Tagetes erecta]|uniref:FBD domain-containing protein n=1 Tax=Tagetes erecta TaxID=13708 RepID=A0AAD8JYI0_TARER|nr:hypothetical protein QVD17_33166 [Tagetes erecta]